MFQCLRKAWNTAMEPLNVRYPHCNSLQEVLILAKELFNTPREKVSKQFGMYCSGCAMDCIQTAAGVHQKDYNKKLFNDAWELFHSQAKAECADLYKVENMLKYPDVAKHAGNLKFDRAIPIAIAMAPLAH